MLGTVFGCDVELRMEAKHFRSLEKVWQDHF